MGLAASQARLLTLTARKADLELDLTMFSAHKMALTREMSQLTSEYYSKLQSKQVAFYANNKYNTMTYSYLMGGSYTAWQHLDDSYASMYKSNNSMILTDYKGQVVLSSDYAKIFSDVMGLGNAKSGKNCSPSTQSYAKMIHEIACTGDDISENDFVTIINGGTLESSIATTDGSSVDNTSYKTSNAQKLVNFYLPILKAAATNGWTTEYEEYYTDNSDYISDALISGTLQLALVDDDGNYTTEESINYFINAGLVQTNSTSDEREAITAWYEDEKLILTNKETYWDTEISNSSTELDEIKTEIDSVKSMIDDAMSVFEWNT